MDQVVTVQDNTLTQKITGLLEKRPVILQLMRFGSIGAINTSLDFVVLNFIISAFHITVGSRLGWANIPGFVLAVAQSYVWNRFWTFSEQKATLTQNIFRLFFVGLLGALTFVLAVAGSKVSARPVFFVGVLVAFMILQFVMWQVFGLFKNKSEVSGGHTSKFGIFLLVSIVGLAINSGILVGVTSYFQLSSNATFNANLAKILATVVSLIWNFIGYKLLVFKK